MKKSILTLIACLAAAFSAIAQSVGIGTITPDTSAALEIKSSNKGVLFPRLTMAQREAIPNPANGLHVFNTDLSTLEFYDTASGGWQQYAAMYKLRISANTGNVVLPSSSYSLYFITIDSGVTVSGITTMSGQNAYANNSWFPSSPLTYSTSPAINLDLLTTAARVIILNHGRILGAGGHGGYGGGKASNTVSCSNVGGGNGSDGGDAIKSAGARLIVYNYGIIGGGGGGGGGGKYMNITNSTGGGGGGGAGANGFGGDPGQYTTYMSGGCYFNVGTSAAGNNGTYLSAGTGGVSNNGYPGLNGGALGAAGVGNFFLSNYGFGGAAGKAIGNNAGHNIVSNLNGGAVYGGID